MMLQNSAGVIDYFGYWPQFCDAKIKSFAFIQPGTIKLSLAYIDSDKNKRAEIDLVFSGVTNIKLGDLRIENVIDELSIRDGIETEVRIEAAFGLSGSFSCTKGEVVHATYA